jgi:hypothetical protein
VDGLAEQIAGYVTANGFSGVDIDYEDDNGFTGVYDGVTFLIELTNGLTQELPPGQNIITHAPRPPYFDPKARFTTHTSRHGRERAIISPGSTASSTTTPGIARRPAARFPGMRPSLVLQAHQSC